MLSWSAVAAAAFLALMVLRRRPPPQLWPWLFWFYVAVFLNTLAECMTVFVASEHAYWPWMVVLYTGSMPMASLMWLATLGFADWVGHPVRWAGRVVRYGPLVIQAALWPLLVTNPWHGQYLIARYHELNTYLPLWYVSACMNYATIVGSLCVLLWLSWQTRRTRHARNALTLVCAILLPFIAHLLFILRYIASLPDPTVIAMSGSGVLMAVGIYRHRLFGLKGLTLWRLFDGDADAIVTLDDSYDVHYANAAAVRLLGPDTVRPGTPFLAALAPRLNLPEALDVPLSASHLADLLASPPEAPGGHLFGVLHNTCEWVRITLLRLEDSRGRPEGYSLRMRDVTAYCHSIQALAESEERYRALVTDAPDAIFTLNRQGHIIAANPATHRLLGYTMDDFACQPLISLTAPEDREQLVEAFMRLLHDRVAGMIEFTAQRKDGQWATYSVNLRPVLDRNRVVQIEGIARDVTERDQREVEARERDAQLQEGQRIESLGIMAGGVAHDFNNLLAGVLGHTELLLLNDGLDATQRQRLLRIRQSAERAATLTAQMLAYSGKERILAEPVDLAQLVQQMRPALPTLIPDTANLEYALSPVPTVTGDATQLHHILVALCVNAGEALGETPGTLSVRTGTRVLTAADLTELLTGEDAQPGPYAFLEIEDTGCGMDADTVKRVFDPFFSTKFTGRGLGLAAVHGVVRAHNGAIRTTSTPGNGSIFTVYLPATAQVPNPPDPVRIAPERWDGNGTILVVDDEETIREIVEEFLTRHGYSVLTACDGQDGVECFVDHADEISAVLLDLTMPRMMGGEAYQALRALRADVPIIFMSGYTAHDVPVVCANDHRARFLPKPFRAQDLAETLRGLLES